MTDIRTDGQRNVLPGRATLSGDARALNRDTNARIEEKLRQIVSASLRAYRNGADTSAVRRRIVLDYLLGRIMR